MLKEICESLGLNVDDIKQRRKKLLIERISQVAGGGGARAHESDSSLIEQLRKQLRFKINVFLNGWLLFPVLFGTYSLMFQEYHALPVQASLMLHKFSLDTMFLF